MLRGPLRLLVLDFDGVVLESNDLKTEAFAAVFARFPEHADAMMAFHLAHVSESRYVKFRHLVFDRLRQAGNEELVSEIADAFSADMRARLQSCPFVAGAREFLERWHARVPLAVASMTPEPELLDVIASRGLARYFDHVFGCPPWSKVTAIREAVRRTGVTPEETLLIGDSTGDWNAAREVGVAFIGRDSGLPFPADAPAPLPDLHVIAERLGSYSARHV
jgi:phosphoglycolate phosphatase-like HAD superfamily hydrolase